MYMCVLVCISVCIHSNTYITCRLKMLSVLYYSRNMEKSANLIYEQPLLKERELIYIYFKKVLVMHRLLPTLDFCSCEDPRNKLQSSPFLVGVFRIKSAPTFCDNMKQSQLKSVLDLESSGCVAQYSCQSVPAYFHQ